MYNLDYSVRLTLEYILWHLKYNTNSLTIPLQERVHPIDLTSLSYNMVILHIDSDQIKAKIQTNPSGIGLNYKSFKKMLEKNVQL